VLTADQERELVAAGRQGDEEALDRLLRSSGRFVVSIAQRYRASGQPLADLVDAGRLGLSEAWRSFGSDKGYRFTTYATWFIRQRIVRRIADGGVNL
jgi:RNA polymerase primary sigma factor